ncbi:MAG: reverse transcriptase domain-containing protein [Saprospiraceae bacterium]
MRHNKDQRDEIAKDLRSAKDLNGLLLVLNKLITWNNSSEHCKYPIQLIDEKTLKYFVFSKNAKKYTTFTISKKSGGMRTITAPNKYLKNIQRLLNICIQALYYPMPQAHGFIPERSIVTNATMHTGKKYVYNIDLKDFFPSIGFARVWAVLYKTKQMNLDKEVARIIATLTCHEGSLPQGAPTSPTISNVICISLDAILYKISKKRGFTYTRYADDITISSDKDIFSPEFKEEIANIINEQGFELNPKKERLQLYNVKKDGKLIRQRQVVTGITVNYKTNVNQKYIRNLEATLYNWEKYGYNVASMLHEHFYRFSKGFTRYDGVVPCIENVVNGRVEYLGMVRGKDNPKYQYLKVTFDSLCMKESYTTKEMEDILSLWQSDGLEAAMNLFYDRRNLAN